VEPSGGGDVGGDRVDIMKKRKTRVSFERSTMGKRIKSMGKRPISEETLEMETSKFRKSKPQSWHAAVKKTVGRAGGKKLKKGGLIQGRRDY